MRAWSFQLPTRVVFGAGVWLQAPAAVSQFGRKVLLVTGARSFEQSGLRARLLAALQALDCQVDHFSVSREPDTGVADAAAALARTARSQVVLAVGGGSALDVAKAAASLATNPGAAQDYLEGLPQGGGTAFTAAPLPLVAVPTSAGTGSEVTKNAVLQVPEYRIKRSMRAEAMFPELAFVDPELSAAAPPSVRAGSGFDALAHLIEAFCSTQATPLTLALCRAGILDALLGLRGLGRAAPEAALHLALAATLGGVALSNAGLGAAHGLVAPLGGLYEHVPHGAALACLLPATLEANAAALRRGGGDASRLLEVAGWVAGPGASVSSAAAELTALRRTLGLPALHTYANIDVDAVIAAPSGSIKTNPVALTHAELRALLSQALLEG